MFVVLALAALSLFLPWGPVYDIWAWLVWGRELAGFGLDTSGGPSWKPLPVAFTTPFAAAGDAAPALWLLVARAGWLAALALAALLAARIAARGGAGRRECLLAGALAGVSVLLLQDSFTPWLRQFAGGLSEPLLTALVLGAVERGLAGRPGIAFALGTGAALARPEAWPLLGLYGIWLWRTEPRLRVGVGLGLTIVAVLWFALDLAGSGNLFTGAERAREGTGSPPIEALEALARAAGMPLWLLWAGAAAAVGEAIRRRDRELVAVAAGGLGWIAIVAVMAAAGYAGLPRFMAPAAALVCVIGAVGVTRLVSGFARRGARVETGRRIAAGLLVILLVTQAVLRGAQLDDHAARASAITTNQERLFEAVDATGIGRLRACSPITVAGIQQTALAWKLELPLEAVTFGGTSAPPGGVLLRRHGEWRARGCG